MLITRNDILKHVDRNYYLEEEGEQVKLCCFFNYYNTNGNLVKYSWPVDFSNEELSFREEQIKMAKKEVVDMIERDSK